MIVYESISHSSNIKSHVEIVCNLEVTNLWLMDDFSFTLTSSDSFIHNQNNYKHQANMDIYA